MANHLCRENDVEIPTRFGAVLGGESADDLERQVGRAFVEPGDEDNKNLGGVPATLDVLTAAATYPGPLSRNGYYLLDDSRSALWDKAADWVKPRPEEDSQDWYFLVYGNDYAGALGTLAKLIGPFSMLPRYVFGSWFGSRACYTAEEWKMIVDRFREEGFPLDVLVLDSYSTVKFIWSGRTGITSRCLTPGDFSSG